MLFVLRMLGSPVSRDPQAGACVRMDFKGRACWLPRLLRNVVTCCACPRAPHVTLKSETELLELGSPP